MFNLSGSEIVFLLIIGLVVLGPEKLPTALRKAGRLYGEFKRITTGAESEFRTTFAEPIREMTQTANTYKSIFSDAAGGVTAVAKDIAKDVTTAYKTPTAATAGPVEGGDDSNTGSLQEEPQVVDESAEEPGREEIIEGI